MNYIKKLESENKDLKLVIESAISEIIYMQSYYSSEKFQGLDNNYAHVTTDIVPRISIIKSILSSI
jgi:hypothetical protein